jgi:hypothetical protein
MIMVSGGLAWMECHHDHDRLPVLLDALGFDSWPDGMLGTEALKPAPEEALWVCASAGFRRGTAPEPGTGDGDPSPH